MSNLSELSRLLLNHRPEIDSRQGQPASRRPATDPIANGKSDRACHEERSTEQPTRGSDTSKPFPNTTCATSTEIPKTDDPDYFIPRRLYPLGKPAAPAIYRDQFPKPTPVGDPTLLVPLTSAERGRLLVKYPPPATINLEPTVKMEDEGVDNPALLSLTSDERAHLLVEYPPPDTRNNEPKLTLEDEGEEAGGESVSHRTFGFNPAHVQGLVFGWKFHVEWYNEQIQKEMEETRRMQAELATLRDRLAIQERMAQQRPPVNPSLRESMRRAKLGMEAGIKDLEAKLNVRWKEAQKFFVDYSDGTKPHVPSSKPPTAAETDEAKNRIIPPIEDNPIAYINSRARHRTCQRRTQPYMPNLTKYNPVPLSAGSTSTRYQAPAARTGQSATPSTHPKQRSGSLSPPKQTPQDATPRDPPKGTPQANPDRPNPSDGGPVHQGPTVPAPKSPAQPSNQAPAPTNQKPTFGTSAKDYPNLIVPAWFPSLDARRIIPLASKSTKARYIEFDRKTQHLAKLVRSEEIKEAAKQPPVEQDTATNSKTTNTAAPETTGPETTDPETTGRETTGPETTDPKTAGPTQNPAEGSHKPRFPHKGTYQEMYSFIMAAVEEAKAMLAESEDALAQ
jgi:hypothetical protein